EGFREDDDTSSMYQVSTAGGSNVSQGRCNNSLMVERPCEILFLDCYSRAYDFVSMTLFLWLLGTYSEEAKNESQFNPWGVTIGRIVFEVEHCRVRMKLKGST
ncbi:11351_t:CDS:2, partial [Diversispora eburnea]